VRSRDEIGELAREFDAMAAAVEEREQRLIRSERLATVGKMAAQIAHEVRNPLASIGLYVELLGDEIPEGPEARRLVSSITSEVDRLTEITETYLRFARLPQPKLEREDMVPLVTSVVEFARAELAQAHIALEVDLGSQPLEVAADESQIRQALLNLIRNAREAMMERSSASASASASAVAAASGTAGSRLGSGGRLRVAMRAQADRTVELSVSDSGPGIAPEHLPKIFDPFFSTKARGNGLGLALVQQMVAEHGGRIDVESPPGGGTTFRIVLPLVRLDDQAAGAASPPARPLTPALSPADRGEGDGLPSVAMKLNAQGP
jgi:two-component system NtrC family sensor kinase